MILWNTTLRTPLPTCPEDGDSRLCRNVGSNYQVTRHDIPNGRISTLTAMTNSVLREVKLLSVGTLYRLCALSHATALVSTSKTTAFDKINSGLLWTKL